MRDDNPFGSLPQDEPGVDPTWQPPGSSPPPGPPGPDPRAGWAPTPGAPFPGPGPGADHPDPGQPQHGFPGQPPHDHPGQPQHGFPGQPPPAAAPPRRRRRIWPWLVFGLPLLFLALIGGCTALIVVSVRGPIDATNAFVADLDNGDLDAAYDALCAAEQAGVDRQAWVAAVGADLGGDITGYRFTEASVSTSGSSSTATVTGTIEIEGSDRQFVFELVQEGGEWKICNR